MDTTGPDVGKDDPTAPGVGAGPDDPAIIDGGATDETTPPDAGIGPDDGTDAGPGLDRPTPPADEPQMIQCGHCGAWLEVPTETGAAGKPVEPPANGGNVTDDGSTEGGTMPPEGQGQTPQAGLQSVKPPIAKPPDPRPGGGGRPGAPQPPGRPGAPQPPHQAARPRPK